MNATMHPWYVEDVAYMTQIRLDDLIALKSVINEYFDGH